MQKTAPTFGRLAAMVIFALSCFGLLLFLWLSFGGTVPLKPKGYRFEVAFPEATQLGPQADVRIAGVNVGKVREQRRDPRSNRTLATIEMQRRYAPIPADTRAMLRQKTLLGETYVELTPGSPGAPHLREGARLARSRVQGTVEFDEILNTFDAPTRRAFRAWQQQGGQAVNGRGEDLNRALGELPDFLQNGTDLLQVLDTDRRAVGRLIKNTGVVFGALTQREDQLHNLIVNTRDVFDTTAKRNERLAETFRVLPTFLDESRATFRRTQRFAEHARPVVRLLRSPTRKLAPTVSDLRALAPDLQRAFVGVRRLIPVSREGLPALSENLRGLKPFIAEIGPFLSELNPILQSIEQNQYAFSDFWSSGGAGLADSVHTNTPGGIGHYLRAFGPNGVESAGIFPQRLPNNRGDTYIRGTLLASPELSRLLIGPAWDCNNAGFTGGAHESDNPLDNRPGCWVAPKFGFQGQLSQYPRTQRDDYSSSSDPSRATTRP
jgi:phospholipid/cholesterol/gamma-HCH transport system substrate-binding protein